MVSIAPITEKAQEIAHLKTDLVWSSLSGDYKGYKNAHKKLASLAVQDYDTFKNTAGASVKGSIPVFSKTFWKIAKVVLLDKLRIKTADEKKLAEITKEEERKQQFRDAVRARIEKHYRRDIDTVYKEKINALVAEKTDKTINFIPQNDLEMLAEEYVRTKGEHAESLINSAIKYSARYFMQPYKEELETTIFNENFIKDAKGLPKKHK